MEEALIVAQSLSNQVGPSLTTRIETLLELGADITYKIPTETPVLDDNFLHVAILESQYDTALLALRYMEAHNLLSQSNLDYVQQTVELVCYPDDDPAAPFMDSFVAFLSTYDMTADRTAKCE